MSDSLVIAGRSFRSRLIVGTGKYKSFQETARALEASGAEMVTVAVRRVNLDRSKESLLDYIDAKKYFLLPNTAGCYTADEAIRAARLGREVGLSDSRLRDLFRKDLGCRLSQYMRWVAAWKAVSLWQQGMKFTDVAHAVGFHDLAHADHAFTEIFGLAPSEVTDARRMMLHKCGS